MNKPANDNLPATIADEAALEELLSRPTAEVVEVFRGLRGDVAILGAGGKIGPSLAAMACRGRGVAGTSQRIIVVSRFSNAAAREQLERLGCVTLSADLLDPAAVAALPDAANVIYMVGQKFGTSDQPARTWAINTVTPAYVARRYRGARVVAFSTGCVYDFKPAGGAGSVETDPLTPPGEYANSCVARERVLEHFSLVDKTPMVLLRLNYAVEMRYGVLVDVASQLAAGRPIDVTMGSFNVIWQGDVNAAAWRLLDHAASPALALNLTGAEKLSVRAVACRLGELMGRPAAFVGQEAPTALLSDARRAFSILGKPPTPLDTVLRWTADWVSRGGRLLNKPTHFQTRDGRY